jgi:RNA polymerase sigma-70 factor (ECF subfamily)
VRRFLARLSRDAADDLAQETFLKAWRMAGTWRGEGSYEGWLLRIAWRSFLSERRRRREPPLDEAAQRPVAAAAPELRLDVERALAALPERERAAALLCYGEGYSHGEAAAILEVPLGTLKSLIGRARDRLARLLEEEDR